MGESIVVGGANYGQGSSREHAALVPLYLGVRAVIAVSFARIHAANLVNAGILPLTFENPADYELLNQGETVSIRGIHAALAGGRLTMTAGEKEIPLRCEFSQRQQAILLAGGLLPYTREENRNDC